MRAAVARMKRGQDMILRKTKSTPSRTEGSRTRTNESDDLQSDVQSSSTIYISINTEEEDGLSPNPSELHQTEDDDDWGPQISSTAENNDPHSDHVDPPRSDHPTDQKVTAEQILVIINFILEAPTAVFDQLSSQHQVQYAFLLMLMSLITMIFYVSEFCYMALKQKIARIWKRENEIITSVTDFIGVTCSILQFMFTTVAFPYDGQHIDNPIKISQWPMIFSFGLLFYKLNPKRSDHSTDQKVTVEQIFVIFNFILEVPSAVFDQLSSQNKVHYTLLSMLMSMATMIICISELVYKGIKERVAWKWKREKKIMPWLYHPAPSSKPFGSVTDIIGVSCSIFQCIFTTADYVCYRRNIYNPIKISTWPIIFSFGLLFSKLNSWQC